MLNQALSEAPSLRCSAVTCVEHRYIHLPRSPRWAHRFVNLFPGYALLFAQVGLKAELPYVAVTRKVQHMGREPSCRGRAHHLAQPLDGRRQQTHEGHGHRPCLSRLGEPMPFAAQVERSLLGPGLAVDHQHAHPMSPIPNQRAVSGDDTHSLLPLLSIFLAIRPRHPTPRRLNLTREHAKPPVIHTLVVPSGRRDGRGACKHKPRDIPPPGPDVHGGAPVPGSLQPRGPQRAAQREHQPALHRWV